DAALLLAGRASPEVHTGKRAGFVLKAKAEPPHGTPCRRLMNFLPAPLRDPGGDLRRGPQAAVRGRCAQRLRQFFAELLTHFGAMTRLGGLPAGDRGRALSVIAAR